jgi:hypothetical protein
MLHEFGLGCNQDAQQDSENVQPNVSKIRRCLNPELFKYFPRIKKKIDLKVWA